MCGQGYWRVVVILPEALPTGRLTLRVRADVLKERIGLSSGLQLFLPYRIPHRRLAFPQDRCSPAGRRPHIQACRAQGMNTGSGRLNLRGLALVIRAGRCGAARSYEEIGCPSRGDCHTTDRAF